MGSTQYRFSFATKMLHTKNTNMPIFDFKVRQYLSNEYGVDFEVLSPISRAMIFNKF